MNSPFANVSIQPGAGASGRDSLTWPRVNGKCSLLSVLSFSVQNFFIFSCSIHLSHSACMVRNKCDENILVILKREQVAYTNATDSLSGCCKMSEILVKQRVCLFFFLRERDCTHKTGQEFLQDFAESVLLPKIAFLHVYSFFSR